MSDPASYTSTMRWWRRALAVAATAVGLSVSGIAVASPVTEIGPPIGGDHTDCGEAKADLSRL